MRYKGVESARRKSTEIQIASGLPQLTSINLEHAISVFQQSTLGIHRCHLSWYSRSSVLCGCKRSFFDSIFTSSLNILTLTKEVYYADWLLSWYSKFSLPISLPEMRVSLVYILNILRKVCTLDKSSLPGLAITAGKYKVNNDTVA